MSPHSCFQANLTIASKYYMIIFVMLFELGLLLSELSRSWRLITRPLSAKNPNGHSIFSLSLPSLLGNRLYPFSNSPSPLSIQSRSPFRPPSRALKALPQNFLKGGCPIHPRSPEFMETAVESPAIYQNCSGFSSIIPEISLIEPGQIPRPFSGSTCSDCYLHAP